MDIRGRQVVLAATWAQVPRDELELRLAGLGALVGETASSSTDVVFGEPDAGVETLGVPIVDEAGLLEVLLRGEQVEPAGGIFVDHGALEAVREDPAALLGLLRDADWSAFVPERDLPPLRERLTAIEEGHGVTEAHRLATGRLVDRGARLRHPYTRPPCELGGPILDFALSPCGRHLATGRWNMGEDEFGTLQIWELATGRAVNTIPAVEGGVGWAGERDTIQWSADGTRLVVGFRTNQVGAWDPFGERVNPFGHADVTDGNDRSAVFAPSPDGRRAYIDMRTGHEVMGCVATLDQGRVRYAHQLALVEGREPELLPEPIPAEIKERLGVERWSLNRVRWSRDGTLLLGNDRSHACAIEVPGGRMRWTATIGDPVAWSPDDRLAAAVTDETGLLTILDAATGHPVGDPVEQAPGSLHWGMRGDEARLAIVAEEGGGVDVYDERGRHRHHLAIPSTTLVGRYHSDGPEQPWAWAPSGDHGACLTADGRIEVWSLGDEPALVRSIDAPDGTTAVAWGADGTIAAIGALTLRFLHAWSGGVLGDFTFGREFDEDLCAVDEDEFLHGMFQEDSFPLDESTWCTLAKPAVGPTAALVIAPEERRADLDAVLAWTVDRRFAWPVRWGGEDALHLVPDAEAAAEALQRP